MSHDDQAQAVSEQMESDIQSDIDALSVDLVDDSTKETPDASLDADADSPKEEQPKEETQEEVQTEAEPENTLSQEAAKSVDRISAIQDEEQRQERIAKLEKSGRKHDLEAAQALRDMYGGEPEKAEPNVDLDELVEKKLKDLGLDPESIQAQKEERESNRRLDAVKKIAGIRGIGVDPDKVVRNKDFVKVFYDPAYSELSIEDRAELAFSKTVSTVAPAKSQSGGVVGEGKEISSKSFDSMDANELEAFWRKADFETLSTKEL